MKLQLKVDEFSIIGVGKGNRKAKLEILANKEDLFEMLDEISPKVLADYMMHRMRGCFEQKRENTGKRFHEMTKEDELW